MGQNKKGRTMSYSLLQESVHSEYGISLTLGASEHQLLTHSEPGK